MIPLTLQEVKSSKSILYWTFKNQKHMVSENCYNTAIPTSWATWQQFENKVFFKSLQDLITYSKQ